MPATTSRPATAFLCLMLSGVPALSCDANPVCTVKDPTGTPLNIRSGPNEIILASVPNGTQLEFIDHVDHAGKLWARVARFDPNAEMLNYDAGVLFAPYLNCDGDLDLASSDNEILCKVADPTDTPLNIRAAPNGEIIGTVRNGETIRVFGTENSGGKVWAHAWRYPSDNAVGWVFDDYLKCEEDSH